MKSNLASFVRDMASGLQLTEWDLEPNIEAPGGRVIIVEGDLASDTSILTRLSADALSLGNYPVDMLACVPPAMVQHGSSEKLCLPASNFVKNGGTVWDGTTRDIREHFPTHRDQLRFVQYDSCRGLEGWTAINYGLDELWEYKYRQWFDEGHQIDDLYQTADELARIHASHWVMIPLTRSIDTLVINVAVHSSFFKTALIGAYQKRRDFIEWIGPSF